MREKPWPRQKLRTSPLDESELGLVRRERSGAFVRARRLRKPSHTRQQVGAYRVKQVIPVELELFDDAQRLTRRTELGHGNCTIERHDGRRREDEELVVERDDLVPGGLL